jgi:hypothetical protein
VPKDSLKEPDWTAVAARAQAYQALHLAGLTEKGVGVVEKARFLMVLGLSRSEAAGLIGSTDESLRKSFEHAAKKGGNPKPGEKATDGD